MPSISRWGNCYDNEMSENFFSILETECIQLKNLPTSGLFCAIRTIWGCSVFLYFQYPTSINQTAHLMRQIDILPVLLLNAMGVEGQATDYIGSEYAAMHWYRKPNFPPCHLAEVAEDTVQSCLFRQTAA